MTTHEYTKYEANKEYSYEISRSVGRIDAFERADKDVSQVPSLFLQ